MIAACASEGSETAGGGEILQQLFQIKPEKKAGFGHI